MRILHAYKIYLPEVFGGIPQVISMLATLGLSEVLTARFRGFRRKYTVEGVPVHATSSLGTLFSMPIALGYPFAFLNKASTADIVVHHAPFPLTDVAIWLGIPKRTPLVVYWHAEIVGKKLLLNMLAPFIRHSLRRADRIVVSDQSIVEHSKFLRPHSAKCEVAPFGCDVAYWSSLSEEQKEAAADMSRKHPRLIISVGRLVGYKGFDVLIRAMPSIDGHAIIVGEGPLAHELRQLAEALNVSHKVTFAGALDRDTMKTWMHVAKAFAFPSVSSSEAFGIVQIEAMAAGLPIINTALKTAVPRIARHEQEGLTVQPQDHEALANAVNRLLNNPDEARRFGESAAARALKQYSRPIFVEKMSRIFENLSSAPRATPQSRSRIA